MALAELHHLIEKLDRAKRGADHFFRTNARCKMPLLFYLPLIVWMGLSEVAQDEMRDLVKVKTS